MLLKTRKIVNIYLLVLITIVAAGCKADNKSKEILVTANDISMSYYDVKSDIQQEYIVSVNNEPLKKILNDWLNTLLDLGVNYGENSEGINIIENLEIKDVYIKGETLIIEFNKEFIDYNNNMTHPIYLINALTEILTQINVSDVYSIKIDGYDLNVIHPDGIDIKDIKLGEVEK
ncbi:MAG: hypothetical protein CVV02_07385 [Firmicutes bacterium HGW-Firmicutes-7]|nr:MAG: hypothetical protein CVV02_07385 [Firmicutes bacterium HGW-Firmicutes-7]